MLKGAMHVHSTYSDGEFTLAELRRVFLDEGCAFVCMTDHAEYFDPDKLRQYQDECQTLSDDQFLFVAGLEYSCEQRMHILGYGATQRVDSQDPETVIRHIDQLGAISVIAHPKTDFFEWIEKFETLPRGIETWNTKYDGRYAPRPETFALLQRLRARKPEMRAFYGQDLHWKKQFRGIFVQLDSASTSAPTKTQGILTALTNGATQRSKGRTGHAFLRRSGREAPIAVCRCACRFLPRARIYEAGQTTARPRRNPRSGIVESPVAQDLLRDIPMMTAGKGRVFLMYHEIELPGRSLCQSEAGYVRYILPLATFRRQMAWIKESGWRGLNVSEALRHPAEPGVCITFDDGCQTDLIAAAPVFREFGFNATFYLTAGFLGTPGYLQANEVRELDTQGFQIGCRFDDAPLSVRSYGAGIEA